MSDASIPVREAMLKILAGMSPRYSELVGELGRPDKTVFVNLRDLRGKGLVTKKDGRYSITGVGRRELRRQSLRRFVDILAELDVDLSSEIAQLWAEKYLWPGWVDDDASPYEGVFPNGCRVVRDFGTKWKYRLVERGQRRPSLLLNITTRRSGVILRRDMSDYLLFSIGTRNNISGSSPDFAVSTFSSVPARSR
jgi:hypothetical protein